jgi:teichuronic acid biosynthesis glycosyltransferase TuaC
VRILLVTTSYPTHADDPSGHFVRTEGLHLASLGHEVSVLVPTAPEHPDDPNIRLLSVSHRGAFGWPGALGRLRRSPLAIVGASLWMLAAHRTVAREGPWDRIIAHWVVPSFWPVTCGTSSPVEVVIHGSDLGVLEGLPLPLGRVIARQLVTRASAVRCVSEELRGRLLGWLSASVPTSLATAHHSLLPRIFVAPAPLSFPPLPSHTELRTELGLCGRALAVVVGRLIPQKRVDVAVASLQLLSNLDVVVIGDGPCLSSYRRQAPSVRWLGRLPRTQTLRWIKAADLLVSASRDEGAPTAVREALALGTPVVALPSGDLALWARSDPNLTVLAGA